ncbi:MULTISPECIES: hypothetical protein [unclassified Beijerinckia]|uniref:hypothetical protein n=1 Tax=unclassified Beijerinckia TaxID=2638183 RepID=UPI0008963873|nr:MULTISPECIES: hypothetical protein [unclassified Beijerinckia]MDH7794135.1 hypothetical protein [Beijerinckia sp. GAS462]SEB54062.1 hypothetical protein SAMN05443249_0400 [Beijerinckia sp. 28-YEA-48]
MQAVRFKAGDTFSFVGQVNVADGVSWAGRGKIRKADGDEVGSLDVYLTGDLQKWVVIEKTASATGAWPKPTTPGATVELFFDYEFLDPLGDTVLSSEAVRVIVEYDPTRG